MITMDEATAADGRSAMVLTLRAHGISDERILAAMGKIRRHLFIPAPHRGNDAYGDHPCPIGDCQTISQPFIVAYMTTQLRDGGRMIIPVGEAGDQRLVVITSQSGRTARREDLAVRFVPMIQDSP